MDERFTCRMRLRVTPRQAVELDRRFDAARRIYNAALGEMLRRLQLMRQSRTWQKACRCRSNKTQRTKLFTAARDQHGFNRCEAINYTRQLVHGGFARERLNINDADCLGKRAFDAVSRMAFGKARRVRFKSTNRLRSLESDSPDSGIRYRDGVLIWRDLHLPVINRHIGDRHGTRHQARLEHALAQRICFARLIRQRHGTQWRYYVQLVLDGKPLPTVVAGDRELGLDVNVSLLAYAGEHAAGVLPFASGLVDHQMEIRRLQRHVDRQRRVNNPGNYHADGTVKRGPKRWHVSRRMRVAQARLADVLRRQADQRHNENGRVANTVVSVGKHLHTEALSVKGWQQRWGRQIAKKAPAGCVARIARKAESAGGYLHTFPTKGTKLSSTCICGRVAKKSLSERVHRCPDCGLAMHRDLLSAYLALFVEGDTLHVGRAQSVWPGAEPHLRAAWSTHQSASAVLRTATPRGQSGSRAMVPA